MYTIYIGIYKKVCAYIEKLFNLSLLYSILKFDKIFKQIIKKQEKNKKSPDKLIYFLSPSTTKV